jgi:hypothetical protein
VKFEALTAVKIQIMAFWLRTPCSLIGVSKVSKELPASIFRVKISYPEDGGDMF